jgi:hypothetical protein
MNYKNFDDIGSDEPRGWKIGKSNKTNIEDDDEDEDKEIPVPYCDEFEEDECDDQEDQEEEISTQDDETSSVGSTEEKFYPIRRPRQTTFSYVVVLQEEDDFIQE